MGNKFVYLKLHTEYSLLEGVGKIDEYVEKAKEIGVKALAINDTSMFGAIEFFKKCKNAGIKPIIGLEVFLDGLEKVGEYSLTLLAKNQNGYKNLSKLSSISYSRFTRNRNKIKYDELKKYDISPEETMAFGDQWNDLEMLKFVKYGYLMGNATEELKQEFSKDKITLSNDEDGIYEVIKTL